LTRFIPDFRFWVLCSLFFAGSTLPLFGQEDLAPPVTEYIRPDSSRIRSPKTATILALCLPGAGQVYNRKYWKLPLVYAALGTSAGFLIYNRSEVRQINRELEFRFNNNGSVNDPKYAAYSSTGSLIQLRNQFKNYRDFSILALTAAYGLQVIDAVVDAHLSGFDMNQPLSLNLGLQASGIAGVGLTFRLGQTVTTPH
jgi:hypothetical protein